MCTSWGEGANKQNKTVHPSEFEVETCKLSAQHFYLFCHGDKQRKNWLIYQKVLASNVCVVFSVCAPAPLAKHRFIKNHPFDFKLLHEKCRETEIMCYHHLWHHKIVYRLKKMLNQKTKSKQELRSSFSLQSTADKSSIIIA